MDNLSNAVEGTAPMVTKQGVLGIQVCVPKDWSDKQVLEFAEKECPCGTTAGWGVRKVGDKLLNGALERVVCKGRSSI